MTSVSLGENSKLIAHQAEREGVRKFYKEVFDCPATRESERIDVFRIGTNFSLGVVYDDSALSATDGLKSIWLEIRTPEPEVLKAKTLEFRIKEIQF
jgi:hypothetical protein